jgi:hypothetical protein
MTTAITLPEDPTEALSIVKENPTTTEFWSVLLCNSDYIVSGGFAADRKFSGMQIVNSGISSPLR